MSTAGLTDKQRQALEHVERARSQGMKLSDYAQAHGVSARAIYDGLAALRRKGILPRGRASSKSPFVAVRVTHRAVPATTVVHAGPRSTMICRVLIGGSAVVECAEWPPVAWLAALTGRTDAAA
jgi:hypothetical protein